MRIASSTGLLLKTLGFNVTAIKIDPYMNIDAGTMSPTEHGKHPFFLSLSFSEGREFTENSLSLIVIAR